MNSVLKSQTEESLIAGVVQTFRNPINRNKVLVALEGKDDINFYKKIFSEEVTILEFLTSKAYYPAVFAEVNTMYPTRFMGICDADFDNLNATSSGFDNLFMTEFHDTEILTLSVGCGEEVCEHYGTPIPSQGVLTFACEAVRGISYIKWYNQEVCKSICFDGLHPDPYYLPNDSIDMAAYWAKLKSHPANSVIDVDAVNVSSFVSGRSVDLLQITNGHDAYRFLFQYVHKNNKALRKKDYNNVYAGSFNINKFRTTDLFRRIIQWADSVGATNLFNSFTTGD